VNAADYKHKLDCERDRISHDLVRNIFFAGLQPCWEGTGRFGDQDVIYNSLLGNADAKAIVAEVITAWREEIAPAILKLVSDVSGKYGFVTSERWTNDVDEIRQSCAILSGFPVDITLPEYEARSIADAFWKACDTMYRILSSMKTNFGLYFRRWERTLINA
jgi:hypothetical protein